jgi:hypothetical protein
VKTLACEPVEAKTEEKIERPWILTLAVVVGASSVSRLLAVVEALVLV